MDEIPTDNFIFACMPYRGIYPCAFQMEGRLDPCDKCPNSPLQINARIAALEEIAAESREQNAAAAYEASEGKYGQPIEKEEWDTHNEFTIRWKNGAYYVSTPNLESMRVVPKTRLTAAEQRADELEIELSKVRTERREAKAREKELERERDHPNRDKALRIVIEQTQNERDAFRDALKDIAGWSGTGIRWIQVRARQALNPSKTISKRSGAA